MTVDPARQDDAPPVHICPICRKRYGDDEEGARSCLQSHRQYNDAIKAGEKLLQKYRKYHKLYNQEDADVIEQMLNALR